MSRLCLLVLVLLPDGSVLVVVGDVSGKGLSAAMTVSTIIGALRTNSVREPSEVLTQLNLALHGFISGFATCCVALLTPDGRLSAARAMDCADSRLRAAVRSNPKNSPLEPLTPAMPSTSRTESPTPSDSVCQPC